MEEYQRIARNNRLQEIKGHAIAFSMLAISLVALYTHVLYFAIIPLLWMAFRIGKEQGRDKAHQDIEQAKALAGLIKFPEQQLKPPAPRPPSPTSRLRQYPQH